MVSAFLCDRPGHGSARLLAIPTQTVRGDCLLVVGVTPTGNRVAGKFAADATQLPTGCQPESLTQSGTVRLRRSFFSDDCYTYQWISPAMVYLEFDFVYRGAIAFVVTPARLLEVASLWDKLWQEAITDGGNSAAERQRRGVCRP